MYLALREMPAKIYIKAESEILGSMHGENYFYILGEIDKGYNKTFIPEIW